MTKITEEQLIKQLQALKSIKPNEQWASLMLNQIIQEAPVVQRNPVTFAGVAQVFSGMFLQRKLAYSLAAFAFVMVGFLGFAQYTVPGDPLFAVRKLTEQSQANLTGASPLTQSIASLRNRINDLAVATKQGKVDNLSSVAAEIKKNASGLAKAVQDGSADRTEVKEIAATLRTLADVSKTDALVNADADVVSLYKTVVEAQIEDFKEHTMTEKQQEMLRQTERLATEGRYAEALEMLLSMSQ